MSMDKSSSQPKRHGNHAARLAAVQALYQVEQAERNCEEVIQEFLEFRLQTAPEQKEELKVNRRLFESVVRETYKSQEKIDGILKASLPAKWALERIDSVLRAILRAGCAEFLMDKDVPAAVIINEYINVAKDFFSGKEPGFVNGLLDHVAHELGLKKKEDPEAPVKDFTKEYNTSGVPNWEQEGGAS